MDAAFSSAVQGWFTVLHTIDGVRFDMFKIKEQVLAIGHTSVSTAIVLHAQTMSVYSVDFAGL